MDVVIVFLVVGVFLAILGLYNLGSKARQLEQTDEDFFQHQLILAKRECYKISTKFAKQLAIERNKYVREDSEGNLLDDDWMSKSVESFFQTTICPQLVDVQRECLIQFGAYSEIIDQVASNAKEEL